MELPNGTSVDSDDHDCADGAHGADAADVTVGADGGSHAEKWFGNRGIRRILTCRAELQLIRALSDIIESSDGALEEPHILLFEGRPEKKCTKCHG